MKEPTLAEQIKYHEELGYKDPYRAAILASLRRLQAVEHGEGMPGEPKRHNGLYPDDLGVFVFYEDYDTLRACALRWKADGERYRWLRDGGKEYAELIQKVIMRGDCMLADGLLDAAIDAEIAKERGE